MCPLWVSYHHLVCYNYINYILGGNKMNKLIKELVEIADKENIELISLTLVVEGEPRFKKLLRLIEEVNEIQQIEADCLYMMWTELRELILAPILNEKILEDVIIKINSEILEMILEDSVDFEEKKNYFN